MKLYLISIAFVAALTLSGCQEHCTKTCGSTARILLVGYSFDQLDTVVINRYTNDGLFDHLVTTASIPLVSDSTLGIKNWNNALKDTASWGDTLACLDSRFYMDNSLYDYEVIIPSAGKRYRITAITFSGNVSEQFVDVQGDCEGNCARHFDSYKLDGTIVNPPSVGGNLVSSIYLFR